jgi:hypothetical protein
MGELDWEKARARRKPRGEGESEGFQNPNSGVTPFSEHFQNGGSFSKSFCKNWFQLKGLFSKRVFQNPIFVSFFVLFSIFLFFCIFGIKI